MDEQIELMDAVLSGKTHLVKKLIETNPDVDIDSRTDYGETLLMQAIYKGHLKIADYLLSRGANIHFKNKSGFDAFSYAISLGDKHLIKRLVALGAVPNL